ncbi:MAG: 2-succinyl-5-enolpyruvyl-6-hydroxy-3-cyclohexene-1-carboxylic-acid synthase [Limnothrix sp.]
MGLNFSNINSLWAGVMVETLLRLGLRSAVICPGSRSTPLTVALARHDSIRAIAILDERSAAFWALGLAKSSGLPTVLVCTSGTAGANFYPAVIEAYQSAVPLIILTGDRPPELRRCASGQTIDQIKLFGDFAQYFSEMATPVASVEMLQYARQTMVQAWRKALLPQQGVVHLNCPFRDPLAPIPANDSLKFLRTELDSEHFFQAVQPLVKSRFSVETVPLPQWQKAATGIIIAGVDQPANPEKYCQAIARLSNYLGYPVLAEALSPVRNYADYFSKLITSYDFILRDQAKAEALKADVVIQIGALPTSKILRAWLQQSQPQTWILSARTENLDPLHNPTQQIQIEIEQLLKLLPDTEAKSLNYASVWQIHDRQIKEAIACNFKEESDFVEAKIAWHLSQHLPANSAIVFANSMTVRYAEFFWQTNHKKIQPYFNRGANGIDGTLSTALGIAQNHSPCVLLTGDLALLHDTNGFLTLPQFQGSLTIVVVNNNGGGIFEMLAIAAEKDLFEEFFATPQTVDLEKLCAVYGVSYQNIATENELISACETLPQQGVRLLEIRGDRHQNIQWLKSLFEKFSGN